jgi:hypothetical protein
MTAICPKRRFAAIAAIRPQLERKPTWRGHRDMCGCNLVTPRLIGSGPRNSGSFAMLAAMRRASSRVRSFAVARLPNSSRL